MQSFKHIAKIYKAKLLVLISNNSIRTMLPCLHQYPRTCNAHTSAAGTNQTFSTIFDINNNNKNQKIQAQVSKTRRECHVEVLVATHTSDCLIIYVWLCDGRGEGLNPSVHHVKIVFQHFSRRIKNGELRLKF